MSGATERRRALERAFGGEFELGELLGSGGFAEVYSARDVRLERQVAIKVLKAEVAEGEEPRERFQREATSAAKLRHPNIAEIYSVGESGGIAYIVMPLVSGENLDAYLERAGPLPIPEARRMVKEVASALSAAHTAGIIHRDIKPANILLDGEERRVLVTDFGIAKAAQSSRPKLTGTGLILGTPAYMSPEQAAGDPLIDHRSDMYSLGVVAFQMITGRLPFDADSARAVLLKHIAEDAPPVRALRPDCPRELARAVDRCLHKEPAERWDSAAEFIEALEPQETTTFISKAAGTDPRLRKFRRDAAIMLVGNSAAVVIDLTTNEAIDFFPAIAAVSILAIAFSYSRIWVAGYGWRDIFSSWRQNPVATVKARRPHEQPGFDPSRTGVGGSALKQIRTERALVVGILARLPHATQEVTAGLVPAIDALLAHVSGLGLRLQRLERTIESLDADLKRVAWSEGLSRRDERAIEEARAAHGRLTDELERCAVATHEARLALERAAQAGVSDSRAEVHAARATLMALARSPAASPGDSPEVES